MKKIESLFRKIPVKLRFPSLALTTFIAGIAIMQINSYWADKHHANWMWATIAIVFGGWSIAVMSLYVKEWLAEKNDYNK